MFHEHGTRLVRQTLHQLDFYISLDKMPFLQAILLITAALNLCLHKPRYGKSEQQQSACHQCFRNFQHGVTRSSSEVSVNSIARRINPAAFQELVRLPPEMIAKVT